MGIVSYTASGQKGVTVRRHRVYSTTHYFWLCSLRKSESPNSALSQKSDELESLDLQC
jgi:hypothetical protein